ncbi:MAG TPA: hypothetical protein VLA19_16655 [Herpetosiphonaceae bacterium]|nr:hypothetical protein [Herpetosiphonaceae bacterium]
MDVADWGNPSGWADLYCRDKTLDCLFHQRRSISTKLLDTPRLADGRSVYVIAMDFYRAPAMSMFRGHDLALKLTIKVDTADYSLVEIVEQINGKVRSSLQQIERRVPASVTPDFFTTLPASIPVAEWATPTVGKHDRVWIEAVTPAPGAVLSGQVPFEITVGYELVSVPEAELKAVLWGVKHKNGLSSDPVRVTQGEGRVKLIFDVNTGSSWIGAGDAKLGLSMGMSTGLRSRSIGVTQIFDDYRYNIK